MIYKHEEDRCYVIANLVTYDVLGAYSDIDTCATQLIELQKLTSDNLVWHDLAGVLCPQWVKAAAGAFGVEMSAFIRDHFVGPPSPMSGKFVEGDSLEFRTTQNNLCLTVVHVDTKHAFMRAVWETAANYRVNLASKEMRIFDQMGWTILEGKFDRHIPAIQAI